jgi:DNA-binding MarR family transcriptional regulator
MLSAMARVVERRRARDVPPQQRPERDNWDPLFRLAWMLREQYLEIARELDLSPPQAGALLQLDPATSLSMGELATTIHCDASTVTGLVDRLEDRGLVERRVSPTDRRVKDVVISARGRELRDRFLARLQDPPAGIARLPAADRRTLQRLLSRAVALHDS